MSRFRSAPTWADAESHSAPLSIPTDQKVGGSNPSRRARPTKLLVRGLKWSTRGPRVVAHTALTAYWAKGPYRASIISGLEQMIPSKTRLAVVARAVIAVAFQPMRTRARRWADRLV